MSLSHYFQLTPERYLRTYYGFPTFYTCTNRPECSYTSHGDYVSNYTNYNSECTCEQCMQPPRKPCVNHIEIMENATRWNR